jgi:hypothetical protein
VLIGIASNARIAFGAGMLIIALSCIVCILSGRISVRPRQIVWMTVLILALLPIFSLLSDLATAIVIVRAERSELSPMETINSTVSTFLDGSAVEVQREIDDIISSNYNEVYIGNPFFKKIVLTKHVDRNLSEVSNFSQAQVDEARKLFWDRTLAILPTPVLRMVALDVNKDDLAFSSGDFYWSITSGEAMEGFRTGSSIADGGAIMGLFYVPLLAVLILINYIIFDALAKYDDRRRWISISPVGVLYLWIIFASSIVDESVSGQLSRLFRGFPVMLILYCLTFMLSRAVVTVFAVGRSRRFQRRIRP